MIDAKRAVNAHLYSHLKNPFLEGQQFSKNAINAKHVSPINCDIAYEERKCTTFYSFKKIIDGDHAATKSLLNVEGFEKYRKTFII